MRTNFRKLLILFSILFFASNFIFSQNLQKKLIVFHMDFNSVSLKKEYIIKWLEKASQMGYNAILWEVEDEIKWKNCPECASNDAFSKIEFKKILQYSRKLGLEPIPLLQTIGHAEYVLQHKKYFPLREDPNRYDCYCTSSDKVKKFIKNWIKEYLELFGDIKYFHLGGDEAYAFATCKDCKTVADNFGKNKLYADYLNEITKPLLEKNIRPCIWSDMILSHPDEMEVISKNFVIWDWNYWDGDSDPEQVMVWGKGRLTKDKITSEIKNSFEDIFDNNDNLNPFYTSDYLKRKGYDVVLCSSSRCYGDAVFIGRNNLHIDNIIGAARKTAKLNLLGNCVTSWAVRIPNFETQEIWFSLAPYTIHNPESSKEKIVETIFSNYFKLNNSDFNTAIEKIGYSFPLVNTNTTGIMWTGLKDSKPAPHNYIKDLIARWENRNQLTEIKESVLNATAEINSGISLLNQIIPKTKSGFEILQNWSKAAYYQYWQSIIANKVLQPKENNNEVDKKEMSALIYNIKESYKNWAKEWMTDISANENSCIIYDVFIDYFNNL